MFQVILLILIASIYLISFIMLFIYLNRFFQIFSNIGKRLHAKFPNKNGKQIHFFWILKIVINNMLNPKNNNTKTELSFKEKLKIEVKTFDKDKINWVKLLSISFKLILLLIIKFFNNILAYIALIIFAPHIIYVIINNIIFKNASLMCFIMDIIFYYIFPLLILLYLGFGISQYSNELSIFLVICYLIATIWGSIEIFNKILSYEITKQKYELPSKYKTYTMSSYINILIGLIMGFASIYYNLYQINTNNFRCNNHFGIIDSIYFSIITFATVGYGDIVPNSKITKILVSSEILASIFALIFLASAYINKKLENSAITNNKE